MPWGKQGDEFDEDPRVMRMLCDEGEAGVTAMGLWQLCFTWANRNTRRRGKRPGLLPPMLPMHKMGPRGLAYAGLLAKHELWEAVGPGGADGWLIVDFANTLPSKDVSSKRSEAGKRGAAKRWAAKHAADADAAARGVAPQAPGDGTLPSPDSKLLQPDGSELPGDGIAAGPAGSNAVLPDGYIRLPSVCHTATSGNGGNEPSDDGTLLSAAHPNGRVDNSENGILLSLDGSLPLGHGSLPPSGSKTCPQSQSLSQSKQHKDSSPTDVGGVIAWPGSASPKGKGRRADYTPEFEAFWTAYGKRGKKQDAAMAWHEAVDRAPADVIMAAVGPYVAATPELRWRQHAEGWLSGDCWESAVPAPQRAAVGGFSPAPYQNVPASAFRHTRI